MRIAAFIFAFVLASFTFVFAQRQAETPSWAPKPLQLPKYVPPNKPHTKIAELRARHQKDANWSEEIVSDDTLHASYIQSAPGTKVGPRFHPDTRAWWIVMDGQMRFNIEGQEPIVATKGSMVQTPMQTFTRWRPWETSRRYASK